MFLRSFVIVIPILGVYYYFIGATLLSGVTVLSSILMIPAFFILRRQESLLLVSNYVLLILWIMVGIIAWNTGAITHEGVIHPSWIVNGGIVLLSLYLLNSYFWGTLWASAVFVELGAIIYLFRMGYSFPNLLPPEISTMYSLGAYLVCLLLIVSMAFLFERERSEASIREHEKSETIRESKEYFDDILERFPVPTFIIDRNHRVIQWNRACRELTGIFAGEILGKGVWSGFDIESRGSVADILLEDPNWLKSRYRETLIYKPDEGWVEVELRLPKLEKRGRAWITASTIQDREGKVRGVFQTVQMIESHERHDEKGDLQSVKDDGFTHPVFRVNDRGEITFWNRACENTFGYSCAEIIGKSALGLLSKQSRPIFRERVVATLRGETQIGQPSWKCYSKDGRPVYVMASISSVGSKSGTGRECEVINTDITEIRVQFEKMELYASERKKELQSLTEEYNLLKRNIATFIRKKEPSDQGGNP